MNTKQPVTQDIQSALAELLSSNRGGDQDFNASIVKRSPELAATLSKLINAREKVDSSQVTSQGGSLNSGITQISNATASKVEENENVFKLFPDIELAVQIIISSMLSPKDMVQTDIIYRLENNRFPSTLSGTLLDILREEVEKNYKLKAEIYDIFRDALFRSGSHPIAILPEAAVDHVINAPGFAMESALYESGLFEKMTNSSQERFGHVISLGYLGTPGTQKTVSLESMFGQTQPETYDSRVKVSESRIKELSANNYFEEIFTDQEKGVKAVTDLFTSQIEVIDNPAILRLPVVSQRYIENRIQESQSRIRRGKLAAAVEAASFGSTAPEINYTVNTGDTKSGQISQQFMASSIYKSNDSRNIPFFSIPSRHNLQRKSVGRPLKLDLPSESLIPIYTPGNYRNHIAYFCVLDSEGTPVTFQSAATDYGLGAGNMIANDKNNQSVSSLLTERAKKNLVSDNYTPIINRMSEIYADVIEKDLIERLSRGIYKGKNLKISKELEIYEVMMYRALKGHFTRILFIPAEYVTYFAFDYNRNGVGRSYLDQLSNITSLRAMVLYSKVWAQVRSSIETTDVKITFDPRDPDPIKTINDVEYLVARSRQQIFPNGLRRIADFTDWIQRAGIRITFDGHPRLPNTNLSFESTNIEHTKPDSELEEDLRHMTYMHFGLSPETVEGAGKANFAVTVENENILFAKRISMLDDIASIDMSDYVRKIARNDAVIQERFVKAFSDNKADIESMLTDEEKQLWQSGSVVEFTEYLIELFISSVVLDLPRPESTTNENLKREIQGYEELVDKVLSYIIDEEMLPAEYIGDAKEYITSLRNAWKAQLMRQFFSDNNIAPEAFKIATMDEDSQPMVNMLSVIESHTNTIQLAAVDMLKRMKARKMASDKDIQNINPGESTADSDSSSSSDDGGSSEDPGDPFSSAGGGFDDDGAPIDDISASSDDKPADNKAPDDGDPFAALS